MKINNTELQRLYKEKIAARQKHSSPDCPSSDQIVRFFERRLSTRAGQRIVDHVTRCPACFQEFEFLIELRRFEKEIALKANEFKSLRPDSSLRSKTKFNYLFQHAAGLVVVIFLLSSLAVMWRGATHATERGQKISTIILFQPAGRAFLRNTLEFSWQGPDNFLEYIVELFDDALKPIWKSGRIASSRILLPEETFALLVPGETYYWMVTAYQGGSYQDESDFRAFSLLKK